MADIRRRTHTNSIARQKQLTESRRFLELNEIALNERLDLLRKSYAQFVHEHNDFQANVTNENRQAEEKFFAQIEENYLSTATEFQIRIRELHHESRAKENYARSPMHVIRSPVRSERDSRSPLRYARDSRSPMRYVHDSRSPIKYVRDGRSPIEYVRDGRSPIKYVRDNRSPIIYERNSRSPDVRNYINEKRNCINSRELHASRAFSLESGSSGGTSAVSNALSKSSEMSSHIVVPEHSARHLIDLRKKLADNNKNQRDRERLNRNKKLKRIT